MRNYEWPSGFLERAVLAGAPRVVLTGPRQVGKSTLVRAVLARGHAAWGYLSVRVESKHGRGYDARLLPGDRRVPYARDVWTDGLRFGAWHFRPQVFDEVLASHLVESCTSKHLLVLDELGFAERQCGAFRDAVSKCLRPAAPVLVVVQLRALPHWLPILFGANLPLIYISESNRSGWKKVLVDLFDRAAMPKQEFPGEPCLGDSRPGPPIADVVSPRMSDTTGVRM